MVRELARRAVRESLMVGEGSTYEPVERRVWLIRPDHLGDLLFVRPGLKRFRRRLPDWHITLAIGPWARAAVEDETSVDEIVEIPFPGFDREGLAMPWQPYTLLTDEARRIRADRPAAAVLLRDDHWWGALMARRAGVPRVIGADLPEMGRLLTDATSLSASHWVGRNIQMLDFAANVLTGTTGDSFSSPANDPLVWSLSDHDRSAAAQLLDSAGVSRPFVVIHPGSGAPVKLWSADRWASVAESLVEAGLDIVLTGSGSEVDLVAKIQRRSGVPLHSLAGATSLSVLAAVFDRALLVAGVDSGPLHLAVAVGTPTIHLYGPSDVGRYGPWGDPAKHLVVSAGLHCPSCGNLSLDRAEGAGCMVAIQEDDVFLAIDRVLPQ
jgi:heptosyltransferase-3